MLFADLDLARRLELADAAKHIDYAEARAKLLGTGCCAWERVGGGYAIFAGLDNPYSRVVGLGLAGPVSEAAFEQSEAFYRRRSAQPAFSLCPLADPTLLEHLNRHGYQVEMFMHVWYRPLAAGETFPPPPSGIIARAIEPEEANLWTLVAFRGGLDSDEALPNDNVIIAPYPFMAQARCWLAWRDDEPGDQLARRRWRSMIGWRVCSARARACRIATSGCSTRSSRPGWPRPRKPAAIWRSLTLSRGVIRSATLSGWGSGWGIPR